MVSYENCKGKPDLDMKKTFFQKRFFSFSKNQQKSHISLVLYLLTS